MNPTKYARKLARTISKETERRFDIKLTKNKKRAKLKILREVLQEQIRELKGMQKYLEDSQFYINEIIKTKEFTKGESECKTKMNTGEKKQPDTQ